MSFPAPVQAGGILAARGGVVALSEWLLLAGLAVLKSGRLLAGTPLATTRGDLGTLVFVLTAGSVVSAMSARARRVLLLVAALALSLMFFADQVHQRAYRDLISVRELGHAGQLASVFSGVLPYVRWSDLWFVADVPVWLWLSCRPAQGRPEKVGATRRLLTVVAFLLGATGFTVLAWDYLMAVPSGGMLAGNQRFAIREIGVLGFHLFDGVDWLRTRPKNVVVRADDVREVQEWLASRPEPGPEQLPFGVARGANLVFLQLESFEAFLLGLVVNGQEITPRLNRLRREAWHFTRFFPQSGVGTTSDAEFCALNSLLPAVDEPVTLRNAANTFRALPGFLAREGYHTMAMSVCRPDLWNMGWMHRQYGFNRRYYYETFTTGRENPMTISDDRFLARARELIRTSPRPFFAHLMTISSHAPFLFLPRNWPRLDLGSWQRGTLGDYLQSAHFVDHAVGEFLDGLRADGVLERTVVFIYGDHEALPPDDRWAVRPLEADEEGSRLDERLRRRVPLLVLIPGQAGENIMDRPGGQADLGPSAMHLLGVDPQPRFQLGRNLFRGTNAMVVFRNGSFITDSIYFNSPDGLLGSGGCEPTHADVGVDPAACTNAWRQARQLLRVSDLIRNQDMIPALEAAVGNGK